ncbi:MAG: methionyl-tRNA formyltransferase [Deltaproteobacteria bacterium]|nr:methionyl-tRNA formyltransferase [Deltaproteobacteria bacterium]
MARLAFFGTPALAAAQLEALLASAHEVALVVAQPDRPAGRGKQLQAPPTKALALARGIEVAQPETLKKDTPSGEAFFALFSSRNIDLAVVAAYGRIIPRRLLDVPPRSFVNVHASLLPRWRGAAPIQRAIEAGDATTGVCLMHMVPELDAGDVYATVAVPITPSDDGETLTAKVAAAGARLLAQHIDALAAGTLPRVPQPAEGVTYAEQLEKEQGRIDWSKSARRVVDHARAMHPWPGAFTTLGDEVLKLFAPSMAAGQGAPGTVLSSSEGLVVACGDGAARFADAQLPNKRRMPVAELIKGRPLPPGTALGAAAGAGAP